MATWTVAWELNARREITASSDAGLRDAIRRGADLRIYTEFRHNEHLDVTVAIRGLCADLAASPAGASGHELFIQTGPGYLATERKIFSAGNHPLVRVVPAIPMRYQSDNWDFGWLMPRRDGFIARWLCDPYQLAFANFLRGICILCSSGYTT